MFVFSVFFFHFYFCITSLKASSREVGKSPIPHIRCRYIPSQQVLLLFVGFFFFELFCSEKGFKILSILVLMWASLVC